MLVALGFVMFTLIFCQTLFDCAIVALYHFVSLRMINCCWCPVNSQLFTYVHEKIQHIIAIVAMELCRTTKPETHTFTKALVTVEVPWLLKGIASYHFVNWSPINLMYLFPLDGYRSNNVQEVLRKWVTWFPCCQAVYVFLVWRLLSTAYVARTYALVNVLSNPGPVESFVNPIKCLDPTKCPQCSWRKGRIAFKSDLWMTIPVELIY